MGKRPFGTVRKLPSGRFQASFLHEGKRVNAPHTFVRERDAELWLSRTHADISRDVWSDEREAAAIKFGSYAREYLTRPEIGDKWRKTCLSNMRLHLADLEDKSLRAIKPRVVRTWHEKAIAGTGGRVSIAQSYRFLRAVMNQAIRDEIITRNPCKVRGAGADTARERPVASVAQVAALVEAITPARYRAPALLAAWCALRRGEIVNLRPEDVDLVAGVVKIREAKTDAGVREVAIPPHIIADLEAARQWSSAAWFFTSPRGGRMSAITFYHAVWRARTLVGLEHITIHDLRHTSNSIAAAAGATTKDLMLRMGHATEAAARRYLHTVEGRDAEIARELSAVAKRGDAAKLPVKSRRSRTRRRRGGSDLGK